MKREMILRAEKGGFVTEEAEVWCRGIIGRRGRIRRIRRMRSRRRRRSGGGEGEWCRRILTASATVSLEFSLLFSSASGAAGGADLELRLLGGPAEHEMRPTGQRMEFPVEAGRSAALGAGVFQPFLQADSFFFRGHGDWFQPELPVLAAQHARLKHETRYRVTPTTPFVLPSLRNYHRPHLGTDTNFSSRFCYIGYTSHSQLTNYQSDFCRVPLGAKPFRSSTSRSLADEK